MAIFWDFLLQSLLIYGTYCELDVSVGENSIPQTETCHSYQGTDGIWKTGKLQGKYSECQDGAIVWAGRCFFESSEGFTTIAWAVCTSLCFPRPENCAVLAWVQPVIFEDAFPRWTSSRVGFFLPPIPRSPAGPQHPGIPISLHLP